MQIGISSMNIKKMFSFLRWRLKHIRYFTKFFYWISGRNIKTTNVNLEVHNQEISEKLNKYGYAKIPTNIHSDINVLNLPVDIKQKENKSVIDVYKNFEDETNNIVSKIISDNKIASLISNYFNYKPWLWNVSVVYTSPLKNQDNSPVDSQMWHFDYGDTKQLHFMYYLSDVDEESGPFTFLDATKSTKVKRNNFFIERIDDDNLQKCHGLNAIKDSTKLTSNKGSLFVVDPGRLLHQGARSKKPRMVLFISISSRFPMSKPPHLINKKYRNKIRKIYNKNSEKVFKDSFFY